MCQGREFWSRAYCQVRTPPGSVIHVPLKFHCQKNVTYLVSHSYYLLGISLTIRPLFKYCAIYPPSCISGFTSFQDHLKKKQKNQKGFLY